MLTNYLKIFLFVIIVTSQLAYAQDKNVTDSLLQYNTVVEYPNRLKLHNSPIKSVLSLKMPILFENYSDFYLIDFNKSEYPRLSVSLSNYQLKNEMNKSFQIYLKGQKKNDLGFVGEILGYTNAAAALGLAAYHMYKYRHKYFRK